MGRAIIVLGQGRSGTSVVAGILHHLGVYMGSSLSRHYEDGEFYRIHQAMIGDWKNPHFDAGPYLEGYSKLIAERQAHSLWGIKDPRLCFTFPALLPLLQNADARVILPVRPFENIVESMARYPGVESRIEARQIVRRYARALERTRYTVPLRWPIMQVSYDNLIDNPKKYVALIARFIGVSVANEAVELVDPDRRHWK